MTSTSIGFRKVSSPSMVMGELPPGNFCDRGTVKPMLFAKLMNTMHEVFSAIWRCEDERFPARSILFWWAWTHGADCAEFCAGFKTGFAFPVGSSDFCAGFFAGGMTEKSNAPFLSGCYAMLRSSMRIAHVPPRFFGMLVASQRTPVILDSFRRLFLATMRARFATSSGADILTALQRKLLSKLALADFLTKFSRVLSAKKRESYFLNSLWGLFVAQSRTGNGRKIKAALSKRVESGKVVLFASGQHLRDENQFKNVEDESLFSILVPRILQFGVGMPVLPKQTAVFNPARVQVNSTSYIDFARGDTGNAVDPAGGWDITREHIPNCLSLAPCFLVARMQGGISSHWGATPLLGNISILPFFSLAHKAEVYKEVIL